MINQMGDKKDLSSKQESIIREIAKEQIKSYTRIGGNKDLHPILQEALEEFPELSSLDIYEKLTVSMLEFEKVLEEPEYIFQLDRFNLVAARFIVSHFQKDEEQEALFNRLEYAERLLAERNDNLN